MAVDITKDLVQKGFITLSNQIRSDLRTDVPERVVAPLRI